MDSLWTKSLNCWPRNWEQRSLNVASSEVTVLLIVLSRKSMSLPTPFHYPQSIDQNIDLPHEELLSSSPRSSHKWCLKRGDFTLEIELGCQCRPKMLKLSKFELQLSITLTLKFVRKVCPNSSLALRDTPCFPQESCSTQPWTQLYEAHFFVSIEIR